MPKKKEIEVIDIEEVATDIESGAQIKVKIDRRSEGKLKLDPNRVPVMSPTLTAQVESTIAMYVEAKKWKEWGLHTLRQGGSVVLFEGPPGTGKTIIAEYLAARVGRGLMKIGMRDVGGKAPGDTERALADHFQTAALGGYRTIFMDECDTLLVSRDSVGAGEHYKVGVINEALQQIAAYRGLIVMATNRAEHLDPALARRLLARIHVGHPETPERLRIWKQKIPRQYPLQLTTVQFDRLAAFRMTGAEIETAIILESSNAINAKHLPTFATLQSVAESLAHE